MNLSTIIIGIIVAAVIILAAIGAWKNKGKCSGCSGDCAACRKLHGDGVSVVHTGTHLEAETYGDRDGVSAF